MKIKGRKVLVTGGAVRIGAALCRAFASQGADIVIHCNNSRQDAEALAAELKETYQVACAVVQFDLMDLPDLDQVMNEHGPIDILVNNASTFDQVKLADEPIAVAKKQYDINFWAPYQLMQAFKRQGLSKGCIINLLDQRVTKLDDKGASYPLSKKSLTDLTLSAAWQFAPEIRVNGLAPGPVLPPVGLEGKGMTVELDNVPLKKPVELTDLTDACRFLVENESITGQVLYVDCGQHLCVN